MPCSCQSHFGSYPGTMWSIQLTLVLASLHFVIGQKTITINTKLGKIIGLERRTVIDDYPYYSFRRIPFTEPRIGEQRFDVSILNIISSFLKNMNLCKLNQSLSLLVGKFQNVGCPYI